MTTVDSTAGTLWLTPRRRLALITVVPPSMAGIVVTATIAAGQRALPLALAVLAAALSAFPVMWFVVRALATVRLRRTSFVTLTVCSVVLAGCSYIATFGGAYLAALFYLVVIDEQVRLASVAVLTLGAALVNVLAIAWRRLG